MCKWLTIFWMIPVLLIAANNDPRGNSLYGNGNSQAQSNQSTLTQDEKDFANQLSAIHRNVFVNQFTPDQRQDAMALAKAKDPLNTEPGPITPDHSVEIIMQGARSPSDPNMQNGQQQYPDSQQYPNGQQNPNGQQQAPNGQQNQGEMPDQYQPYNQKPYDQRQLPDGCRRY